MYKDKRLLALIPARSGSKGLKDKNIKDLCGKPLLAYAIEAAVETDLFDDIIVSTDSEKYAEIANKYGAETPFLRPASLASDSSLASEYIIHALKTLEELGRKYDYFALLQPTSPLRTSKHISNGVKMAVDENLDGVVAFSESECPMEYLHYLPEDMSLAELMGEKESNRQRNKTCYRVNGMLYVGKCDYYVENRSFYGQRSRAMIVDRRYAIDIDNSFDLKLTKNILKIMHSISLRGINGY